jgi:hypothetical protein
MNRLRHPVRTIREPFGTAGLIVACVALLAALGGGAYAASGLTATQKKEVRKIAQAEAKKQQGVGPQGPAGPTGAKGDRGESGATGATGASGAGVFSEPEPAGAHCFSGGFKVKFANGANYLCNGESGDDGSPWTAGGTLPQGATETGIWTVNYQGDTGEFGLFVDISFPVPVSTPLTGVYVKPSANPDPTHCNGSSFDPKAASGYLCVYEELLEGTSGAPFVQPFGKAGAYMQLHPGSPTATVSGVGTFAVTG